MITSLEVAPDCEPTFSISVTTSIPFTLISSIQEKLVSECRIRD